jgi:hypothetical protein
MLKNSKERTTRRPVLWRPALSSDPELFDLDPTGGDLGSRPLKGLAKIGVATW